MNAIRSTCAAFAIVLFVLAPQSARAVVDIILQDGFEMRYGFEVQTPVVTIQSGEATSVCYFIRTPNTGALAIRRWFSTMAPGMHHVIVYTTSVERQPSGTLTQNSCGLNAGSGSAALVYIAHDPSQDLVFPGDDGNGLHLAMEIGANQPLVIEMFGINPSAVPISTSVLLKAEALNPVTTYTKSATYVTQNISFSIPPASAGHAVQQTCAVPTGSKFWRLSTRTHKLATVAEIKDGSSPVVISTDWQHPAATLFQSPPFFVFSPGGLTYRCVFDNPGPTTVFPGDSETSDESCIGIGYFFPAPTGPKICVNSVGPL